MPSMEDMSYLLEQMVQDYQRTGYQTHKNVSPYVSTEIIMPALNLRRTLDDRYGMEGVRMSEICDFLMQDDIIGRLLTYVEEQRHVLSDEIGA